MAIAKRKDAESPAGSPAGYDTDYYTWTLEQAALLREGRLDAVDIENVAEEIESLGKSQFRALSSSYRIILLHLLKWDHQPERRSRSWIESIVTHRGEIADNVEESPGLQPRVGEVIERAYRRARAEAASQTGKPVAYFPSVCPYTRDEILSRPLGWRAE